MLKGVPLMGLCRLRSGGQSCIDLDGLRSYLSVSGYRTITEAFAAHIV
jgi:hypothetical protein